MMAPPPPYAGRGDAGSSGPDFLSLEGDIGDGEQHQKRRDHAGDLWPDQAEAGRKL
jgi:hypothetical protein